MKKLTKKAFTLIELLVVITIIGILATGGTAVYTSQIQKARDSSRVTDIMDLKGGMEMFFGDYAKYPVAGDFTGSTSPLKIMGKASLDKNDTKSGAIDSGNGCSASTFGYLYVVGDDENNIPFQRFEVSTAFENTANIKSKGLNDSGDDPCRIEVGVASSTGSFNLNTSISGGNLSSTTAVPAVGTNDKKRVHIKGTGAYLID